MKYKRITAIVVTTAIIFTVIVCGCGGDDLSGPVRPTGTVQGTVTDADSGEPIRGATVTLEGDTAQGEDVTDSAGNYEIETVTSGWQIFACSKDGYLNQQKAKNIGANTVTTVNFELPPLP